MAGADVNVLLGGVVQSGATLVAIVGGLLGSRYVALHAEQQAASRRLRDVETLLRAATQRLSESQRALADFQVRDLLDNDRCFEAISQSADVPVLDDILTASDLGEGSVPRAALEEHLRFLHAELSEAAQVLLELVPIQEEQAPWETFRRAHQFQPGHEGVWGWCYEELAEQGAKEARRRKREAQERQRQNSPWGYPLPSMDVPILTPASISAARLVSDTTWRTAEMNRLRSGVDEAQRVVAQLSAERAAATVHFEEAAQPEGFVLALSVLTYLAITSIALPMILMIGGTTWLPLWVRVGVAVLFLSGVALLLRYLYVYAAFLNSSSKRTTLPRSVFGMVFPVSRRRRPSTRGADPNQ